MGDRRFDVGLLHAVVAGVDVMTEGVGLLLAQFIVQEGLEMVNDPLTCLLYTSPSPRDV